MTISAKKQPKRPYLDFERIKMQANGNFTDVIFPAVGISLMSTHPMKHQPCPLCGGKDRFRCDDKNGTGSWICNQCGAGDGFSLVERYTGTSNYELMSLIAGILNIDATAQISESDKQKWRDAQIQRESKQAAIDEQKRQHAAATANQLWQSATPSDGTHPYLINKQVRGEYLRCKDNILLVPLYFTDPQTLQTKLVNVQKIDEHGKKLFLAGGQQKDCFFAIGQASEVVFIGEGVATCAAVYESFGGQYMAVCAFNANNLMGVGQTIRRILPTAKLIFIADNDALTAYNTPNHGNVGIDKATAAAAAVDGLVVFPNL
ncbi:primase-helicase zinc-binding domain-containing protein [Moraxella sp. ZJ142]|uniref:primase-helicase zinc-binding domain-containing protein n=1 Tax=Moraxella marmotae TaxID=3344520 RepID=UPI0035D4878B